MIRLLLGVLFFLLAGDAGAATVVASYCVTYDTDFVDAAVGDQLNGTSAKGRGVLLRFVRPNGTQFGYYMDWNGTNAGCTTISIDNSVAYTVKVVYEASINGNTVQVKAPTGALLATTVATGHVPVNASSTAYSVLTKSGRILAAAGWAMTSHNLGMTGETFDFVLDRCPIAGVETSCDRWVQGLGIFIHDDPQYSHYRYKFLVVHELGHALSDATNGAGQNVTYDDLADIDDCSPDYDEEGHFMNSKEYQSNAAVEAIADFYAAVTFNDGGGAGTGCDFTIHYGVDLDRNGVSGEPLDDPQDFSCEAGITLPYDPNIDNLDYLGDHCISGTVSQNRGTEYDWLRHFWDLYTDYGMSVATIFDIWNHANPHTWNESGDSNGGDYPAHRMHQGAFDVGGAAMQADYDSSAAYNGTSR